MAFLLHIETATEVCSVCLSNQQEIINRKISTEHHSHSRVLAQQIKQILDEQKLQMSDIKAVAVSGGPGSYTGLRVGTSTAKGLCYGTDIPLISVSTLKSLAKGSLSGEYELIIPTIDARRMEVYCAYYGNDLIATKTDFNQVIDQDYLKMLSETYKNVLFCGNATKKIEEINEFSNLDFQKSSCDSSLLVDLAWQKFQKNDFVDLAYFEPFYLKPANITVSKKTLL